MSAQAARQRRLRARQRRDLIVVPTEIAPPVIAALIDLRWLAEERSDCRQEIGSALSRMLAELGQFHGRAKKA